MLPGIDWFPEKLKQEEQSSKRSVAATINFFEVDHRTYRIESREVVDGMEYLTGVRREGDQTLCVVVPVSKIESRSEDCPVRHRDAVCGVCGHVENDKET